MSLKSELCCSSESGRWIRRSVESGGRVMVNCWQGASRSATVVLAFLMMHHDMELSAVLAQVKTRRDIRPNNGFLKQLVTLENSLNQGESASIVKTHDDDVVV